MKAGIDIEPAGQSLVEVIAGHPFLKGVSPYHLQILANCAMETSFQAGETVFKMGDPANRFYLIQSGKVAIESPGADGRPRLVQTIGAGDVLGWSWLFPPYKWHHDARAIEPTEAIFFYGTRLREHSEEDPSLGYELMKRTAGVVIERLQATRRQYLEALRRA